MFRKYIQIPWRKILHPKWLYVLHLAVKKLWISKLHWTPKALHKPRFLLLLGWQKQDCPSRIHYRETLHPPGILIHRYWSYQKLWLPSSRPLFPFFHMLHSFIKRKIFSACLFPLGFSFFSLLPSGNSHSLCPNVPDDQRANLEANHRAHESRLQVHRLPVLRKPPHWLQAFFVWCIYVSSCLLIS